MLPAGRMRNIMQAQALVNLLDNTRAATLQAVSGVSGAVVIYPESGWSLLDVIGHITTWEIEVVNVLRAYGEGHTYRLTYESEEDFNRKQIERRKRLNAEQVYAEMAEVRDSLKKLVTGLTPEQFA